MYSVSIIIITYNRPDDVLDLLKSITLLNNSNSILKDVIIFNNASTVDYTIVQTYAEQHQNNIPFRYIISQDNLGVAKGRNAAVKCSTADLLFFVDDDTIFVDPNTLQKVIAIFAVEKNSYKSLGIVTIQIKYFDNNKPQITAFPHKNYRLYKNYNQFKTYYYAGCGHIIKKEVFEKIGYLTEDFFYGMEEYDFSYRAINAGFSIGYDNRITILHKEAPLGRKPKNEVLRMKWVNKTKVAYRYLPNRYFYSTALLWSLFYLKKSNGDFKGLVKGWKEIVQIRKSDKKNKLNTIGLNYIKNCGGRLWY